MRYFLLITAILHCLAAPLAAGPWLREEGKTFLSTSVSSTRTFETQSSTYLEFGLSRETTLVADLNLTASDPSGKNGSAVLFFRRALGPAEGENKLAYEVGIGADWGSYGTRPMVKTGLTWGRGMQMGAKGGWVTVDGSLLWDIKTKDYRAKLDGTFGLDLGDTTKGILELNLGHADGSTYATFVPSLVIRPPVTDFQIQLGIEAPLKGIATNRIKIGLWREF